MGTDSNQISQDGWLEGCDWLGGVSVPSLGVSAALQWVAACARKRRGCRDGPTTEGPFKPTPASFPRLIAVVAASERWRHRGRCSWCGVWLVALSFW